MLDVFAEIENYKEITLDGIKASEANGNTGVVGIMGNIAEDVSRISKTLFKLEQYYEDLGDEVHEASDSKRELKETYSGLLTSKDDVIKDLYRRLQEYGAKIQNLLSALIEFSDILNIINGFISASKDEHWISQMDMIRGSVEALIAKNGIIETGSEKFFDDLLHEAVSVVALEDKDYLEVIGVERKGYLYMGKVYRKARVVVNNYRKAENANG